MPLYTNFQYSGNGVFLEHEQGTHYCPNRMDAENRLLLSVQHWAEIDQKKAEQEMELLTAMIRS